MNRHLRVVAVAMVTCSMWAGVANAQGTAFDRWLNDEITRLGAPTQKSKDEVSKAVKVAAENTLDSKAVIVPSQSSNASSLIDTSSVSDLVGIGLNLAGLSGSSAGGDEPTSASATVSGYAIYALFKGIEPLDPSEYCTEKARRARKYAATLGYEQEQSTVDPAKSGQVILAGFKYTLPRKDACSADTGELLGALVGATTAAGSLSTQAQDELARLEGVDPADAPAMVTFINGLNDQATLDALLAKHGDELSEWLANEVPQTVDLAAFSNLNAKERELISELQTGHRFAFDFTTKQREGAGTDEYTAGLIWDWDINAHLTFTGNGDFNYERVDGGSDSIGGTAAARFLYTPILPRRIWGNQPVRIDASYSGKFMTDQANTHKGQIGVRIPMPGRMFQGLEIPLSMTVANRTELIDETDVRGMMGFTVDTSQLFGALDPMKAAMEKLGI